MERDNLISRVRNAEDRRVFNFYLTDKAKKACRSLETHANAMHDIATLNISKKDIDKLNQLTASIISNLQSFLEKD
jgi:MarR family transcriptional regulator for hemolysin